MEQIKKSLKIKKSKEEREYEKYLKYIKKMEEKQKKEEKIKEDIKEEILKEEEILEYIEEENKKLEIIEKQKIKQDLEEKEEEYIKNNYSKDELKNIHKFETSYTVNINNRNHILYKNLKQCIYYSLHNDNTILAQQDENTYYYISINSKLRAQYLLEDNNLNELLNISYRKNKDNLYFRLYFDIETTNEDFLNIYKTEDERDEFMSEFIEVLLEYNLYRYGTQYSKIINDSLIIFKSMNSNNKLSYHLIFREITYKTLNDMKIDYIQQFIKSKSYINFKKEKELNKYGKEFIDTSVYKNNQILRLYNQSKYNKNNQLNIIETDLIDNKKNQPKVDDSYIISDKKGIYNKDEIKKIKLDNNKEYDLEIIKPYLREIIDNIHSKRSENFYEWSNILISLKSIDIDSYDIFDNFSKKTSLKNQYNKIENRKIWNKTKINNKYNIHYLLNLLRIDNRDKYIEISKKINYIINPIDEINDKIKNFYDMNINNIDHNNNIEKIDLKDDEIINNQYLSKDLLKKYTNKNLIIQSPMNSGKSTIIYELIKEYVKENKSICIITPRIKYGIFTQKNILKDLNINFDLYIDDKFKDKRLDSKNLIIQIESLSRIKKYKYDLIILDEVKSLLSRFGLNNINCHSNYIKNSLKFESLIQNCDRYIAADGYINNFCIESLYEINKNEINEDNKMKILINNNLNVKRKYLMFSKEKAIINDIFRSLDLGLKIVVYCSYKSTIETIKKIFNNRYEFDKKKMVSHHADEFMITQKEIFDNIDENWTVDLLIYSGSISVGIDYNKKNFNQMYIIGKNINLVNDIIQSSLRCRVLEDNIIKIYLDQYNKDNVIYDISKNKYIEEIKNKENLYKTNNIEYNNVNKWLNNLIIDLKYEKELNNVYFNDIFKYFLKRSQYERIELTKDQWDDIYRFKLEYVEKDKINIQYLQYKKLEYIEDISKLYEEENKKKENESKIITYVKKNGELMTVEYKQTEKNKKEITNEIIIDKIDDEIDKGLIGGEMTYKKNLKSMLNIEDDILNIEDYNIEQKEKILKYYHENYNKKYYYNFKLYESFENIIDIQKFINKKNDDYIELTNNFIDKNNIINEIKKLLEIDDLYIKYNKFENFDEKEDYIKNHKNNNIKHDNIVKCIDYIKNNLKNILNIYNYDVNLYNKNLDKYYKNYITKQKKNNESHINTLKEKKKELKEINDNLDKYNKLTKNRVNLTKIHDLTQKKSKITLEINAYISTINSYKNNDDEILTKNQKKIIEDDYIYDILNKVIISNLFDSQLYKDKHDINKYNLRCIFDYINIKKYNSIHNTNDDLFID